ncbi:hypothetical protein BKA62DRAFT_686280 [Auriculariales sp. MPI-PUGE-AT-0066]|nr:hypothetical protein BKA62DRAFT_686280 [Auriculariales sp. MPI-PUGE-AT-0066]
MSSPSRNEEMWFCHQCHAEMRPLMVPDPHCPNCNSDFVEKIENAGAQDDPREYMQAGPDDAGFGPGNGGAMDLMGILGLLLNQQQQQQQQQARRRAAGGGSGMRFELRTGGAGGEGNTRTFTLGNPQTGPFNHDHIGDERPPPLAHFLDDAFQPSPREINLAESPFGPALLAFLGGHPAFGQGGGAGRAGQFGDYVFDQEGLDTIITQLMEANNANRPVPAPEDLIRDLPRRKVTVQDFLDANEDVRGRECAVCKDTLLPSPDSGEEGPATLVKLPCMHEFHEDCIVPWLQNNSGTCPVCRHELVNQPHHHGPPGTQPATQDGGGGGGVTGMLRNAATSIINRLRPDGTTGHDSSSQPSQPEGSAPAGSSAAPSSSSATTTGQSQAYEPYRVPSPVARPSRSTYNPYRPTSPTSPSAERPSHRRTASGGYVLGSRPGHSSPPRTSGSPGSSPTSGSFFAGGNRAPGNSVFMRPGSGSTSPTRERERRPQAYSFQPPNARYDPHAPSSPSGGASDNSQSPSQSRRPPGAWQENFD